MYVPKAPRRIILRLTTKERKRNGKHLRRKSMTVEGYRKNKMSHSPTDFTAGWTFISSTPEANEELQNGILDVTENKSNLTEECLDVAKDASFDVDKAVNDTPLEGTGELGDDDLPSVTSESESLPSSDVDILEENVGPDHDMLQVSSTSHTSSFSISSPLEVLSESLYIGSANIPSELPAAKQENTETTDAVICESVEPLSGVSPMKSSKKDLVEVATSCAEPQQSSKTPDNLSSPKLNESLQKEGCQQKPMQRKEKSKRHCHQQRPIPKNLLKELNEIIRHITSDIRVVIAYLILWFSVAALVFSLLPYPYDQNYLSPETAAQLKSVQDETLKCLGLQHLTAVENNHYEMLLSNICINDSVAWKGNFEKLIEDNVLKPLINEVYHESSIEKKTEIIERFMSEARNNVQGIKFDLLLRQLEYLELLGPIDEDEPKDQQKDSTAPDLVSEKLEEQQQLLEQLHQFIDKLKLANFALKYLDVELKTADGTEEHADLVSLKPRVYRLGLENAFLSNQLQRVLDQFESGEFLDPEYWMGSFNLNNDGSNLKSNKMEELMEKVNSLLSANEELKGMYSHFSDLKPELKYSDGKETSADKEANSEASQKFFEIGIENIESLVKELLGLHQTLTSELLEIRKWNEMLADVTDELRSSRRGKSSGHWTWSTFKEAFGGIFAGAHQDLTHRLKSIQDLDVTQVLHEYAAERKPFIKDVFQSITNFWKSTGAKSKELIEKALREMNAEFSLSDMFSSFNTREEQHPESKNFQKESGSGKDSGEKSNDFQADSSSAQVTEPIMDDTNSHSEASDSEKADWNKFKADWLFQRSADRENLRYIAKTKPANWYLRRGKNLWRSPLTKEQMELLEKMEVSHYPANTKLHGRKPEPKV